MAQERITWHASARKFDKADDAIAYGKAQAEKHGYKYMGLRCNSLVEVRQVAIDPEVTDGPPLREDLAEPKQLPKGATYNAVWVSYDTFEETEPKYVNAPITE